LTGDCLCKRAFPNSSGRPKKRKARRDSFLAEIEAPTLLSAIAPVSRNGEGRGHPPIGLEKMLRTYVAQQCFELSDEAIEDALHDSQAIRCFVGTGLESESAPDAATLLKFRGLLEDNNLAVTIFETTKRQLVAIHLMVRLGDERRDSGRCSDHRCALVD
jgi:IS5 family transposase